IPINDAGQDRREPLRAGELRRAVVQQLLEQGSVDENRDREHERDPERPAEHRLTMPCMVAGLVTCVSLVMVRTAVQSVHGMLVMWQLPMVSHRAPPRVPCFRAAPEPRQSRGNFLYPIPPG